MVSLPSLGTSSAPITSPLLMRPAVRRLLAGIAGTSPGETRLFAVHGASSSGKSSLLRSIIRACHGWSPLIVSAVPGQTDSDLVRSLCSIATGKAPMSGGIPQTLAALRQKIDTAHLSTLIVIDDAHQLESETLQLLTSFARSITRGRIVLLLAGLTNSSFRQGVDAAVATTPLSVSEIQAFALSEVGADISLALAERIQTMTGGLIGPVEELLESVPTDTWTREAPVVPLPEIWRERFAQRSASLDEDSKQLLKALACVPGSATLELLTAMLNWDISRGQEAVEVLTDTDIVRIVSGSVPPLLGFTSVLDQTVVAASVGPATRTQLHTGAAEFLTARNRLNDALIHKALGLSIHDSATARQLARNAHELGLKGRWKDATRFYYLASQLATQNDESEAYLLDYIDARVAASDIGAAGPQARRLDTRTSSVRQDGLLGFIAVHEGRLIEATTRLGTARTAARRIADDYLASGTDSEAADAGDGNSVTDIIVAAGRATLYGLAHWDVEDAVRAADFATNLARTTPGIAAGYAREAEYISYVARSAQAGRRIVCDTDAWESNALAERRHLANGWTALAFDDPATARQEFTQQAREKGSGRVVLWKTAWLARAQFLTGEWDDALLTVERGLYMSHAYGITLLNPLLAWTGAVVSQFRGDSSLSLHYQNMLTNSTDTFNIQRIPSAMCRILTSLRDNNLIDATRATDELLNIEASAPTLQAGFWPWGDLAANVLVRAKRFDEAEDLLCKAEEYADKSGPLSVQAKLVAERSNQAIHAGDNQTGVKLLDTALDMIEATHLPVYQARLRFEAGKTLRRIGQRQAADEHLARAAEIYQAMGAHAFVERINRERRAGGLGPRTSSPLTVQELEIAQQVASGLTNKEVAAELYLSVKTVEFHLTRVYRKLGIRTRTELPSALARILRN